MTEPTKFSFKALGEMIAGIMESITRSVRSLGIGVQSGDTFTIGVRTEVQDNS